jgi:hypothetical protein
MKNEEDKFKKKKARKATRKEDDTGYLNKESLEEELISPEEIDTFEDDHVVSSAHPENQEWNPR